MGKKLYSIGLPSPSLRSIGENFPVRIRVQTFAKLSQSIRKMHASSAASVRFADQIIVLDDGHVVGIGTHDELLAACPVYQEIYASQFKKEEGKQHG